MFVIFYTYEICYIKVVTREKLTRKTNDSRKYSVSTMEFRSKYLFRHICMYCDDTFLYRERLLLGKSIVS